jgi:hypothetical protein
MSYADEINMSPAHLEAIGRVMVEWSHLETLLYKGIWHFSGLDEKTGRVFTRGLRVKPATEILEILGHQKLGPKGGAKLGELLRETESLDSERNGIVHGAWEVSGREEYVIRLRLRQMKDGETGERRKFVGAEISELDPHAIGDIAARIASHASNVKTFFHVHGVLPIP